MALTQGNAAAAAQTKAQEQLNAQTALSGLSTNVQGQNLTAAQLQAQNQQFNAGSANTLSLADQAAKNATTAQNVSDTQAASLANAAATNATANANAGFTQAAGANNLTSALTRDQQNDTLQGNMLTNAASTSQAGESDLASEMTLRSNNFNTTQGINAGIATQQQAQQASMINGIIGGTTGGIGAMAAMSDKREKTDIKDGDSEVEDFMSKLKPKSYVYKDTTKAGTKPGKQTGIMAQDLSLSEIGKKMVAKGPDGSLRVQADAHGFTGLLASVANLNARLDKLEGKKKKAA